MRRARGDVGTGLIATIAAVLVFLMFLMFAVQLLFGLYATTTITAVAHDTAARAAGREAARDADAQRLYTEDARRTLGRMGDVDRADFEWTMEDVDGDAAPDFVVLTITAVPPRVIPRSIGGMIGFDVISRTVRVRIEEFEE